MNFNRIFPLHPQQSLLLPISSAVSWKEPTFFLSHAGQSLTAQSEWLVQKTKIRPLKVKPASGTDIKLD